MNEIKTKEENINYRKIIKKNSSKFNEHKEDLESDEIISIKNNAKTTNYESQNEEKDNVECEAEEEIIKLKPIKKFS